MNNMTKQEKIELLNQSLLNFGYLYSPLFQDRHECILKVGFVNKEYSKDDDLLVLNSKYKNGKNLYEEYQKKHFYDYFSKDNLKRLKKLLSPYLIVSRDNGALLFRYMTIQFTVFLANTYLDDQKKLFEESHFEIIDRVEKLLLEEEPKLQDAIEKGENSKYFCEEVNKMSGFVKINENDCKKMALGTLLTINSFFKKRSEDIKLDLDLIKSIKNIKPYISINDFLDCFELDKLFVLYGKIVMSKINSFDKECPGESYPLFPQIYNYIHFVEELGLTDYNPKIMYYSKNKNKLKKQYYSFNDLKEQVKSYLKKNPDLTFKYVSVFDPVLDEEHMDCSMEELSKEAVKYRYGEDNQILAQEWEFIRKGEKEKEDIKSKNKGTKDKRIIEEKESQSKERMNVFKQTDYVCQIVGSNKFTGYIGYIYKNGIVAFERFYEEDGSLSTSNNATYIMNIDNFRDFTKLTKLEIIDYIKRTDNPNIKRKYHNKNWSTSIRKIVENDYYTEETKEKVENLMKQIAQMKKALKNE